MGFTAPWRCRPATPRPPASATPASRANIRSNSPIFPAAPATASFRCSPTSPDPMPRKLQGRIALVTGASRGIGRAAAIALGAEGAHVICVARTVGGLEETDDAIQKAGGTATLVPLNLKDFAAIDRLGASIF